MNNGKKLELIRSEPVIFFREDGVSKASLAETPEGGIVVIKNPLDESVFYCCEDFAVDGKILVARNDKIKYLRREWLFAKNLPDEIINTGSDYNINDVLLADVKQLAGFTYRADYFALCKNFPKTTYFTENVSSVLSKPGKELKIFLYGDSISNSANSSGEGFFPPYEEIWYNAAADRIRRMTCKDVKVINRSRSGYGSEWGKDNVKELFEPSDVMIIAFGMNDASEGLSAEKFAENVRQILLARNDGCKFILISSILPNPDSELYRYDLRLAYRDALKAICEKNGGAFIDMTAVSLYYIGRKNYCEISGNNFNHPNDYIYGFYADALTEAIAANKFKK